MGDGRAAVASRIRSAAFLLPPSALRRERGQPPRHEEAHRVKLGAHAHDVRDGRPLGLRLDRRVFGPRHQHVGVAPGPMHHSGAAVRAHDEGEGTSRRAAKNATSANEWADDIRTPTSWTVL